MRCRRLPARAFAGCAFALVLAIIPSIADPASPPSARAPLEVTAIVRSVGPAVVMIRAVRGSDDAIGSGFILSSDGIIVTNYHVVAGATEVQIRVTNGWVFSGLGIMGFDEEKDLALIKVAAPPLTQVTLGDSDALEPGERVVLIGNPQGLKNSVTDGLVSSLREIENGIKVIQTTAPASPGSSGSPLLNMQGEVVGVLSFKHTGGENLNFAVASNHLREIVRRRDLIAFASLVRTPPSTPRAGSTPSVPEPSQPPASSPSEDRPSQAQRVRDDLYNNAYADYANGKYDRAIRGFEAFLQINPPDVRDDSAVYWLGHSYFMLRNYLKAIDELTRFVRDYPRSEYGARGFSRLSEAYDQIGDFQKANNMRCELFSKYPNSWEAMQAKQRGVRCQ